MAKRMSVPIGDHDNSGGSNPCYGYKATRSSKAGEGFVSLKNINDLEDEDAAAQETAAARRLSLKGLKPLLMSRKYGPTKSDKDHGWATILHQRDLFRATTGSLLSLFVFHKSILWLITII